MLHAARWAYVSRMLESPAWIIWVVTLKKVLRVHEDEISASTQFRGVIIKAWVDISDSGKWEAWCAVWRLSSFWAKNRSSDSPIKMEVLLETLFIHTGFFIATFDYWRRIFWKCATFNQSCQWVRIGPILAALGHMVDQIKELTLLTSLVFGSKHPTQFSSSRTTRAVMQGKGHATMGFATIKWTTCNPKWPNNGIFSNVQLA